jgi:hypothetical protein
METINKEEQYIKSNTESKKKWGKKKIIAALVVLLLTIAATCLVIIMILNAEHDIQTILESELLQSQGMIISLPDSHYYTFIRSDGSEVHIEVALRVLGEHGVYYFTPGGWTDKRIAEFVQVSEDGIRFAKDFLGIELSRPLNFVYNVTKPDESHPLPIWSGGGAMNTSVFISMSYRRMPTLIVHEAVHAILQYDERSSNFPFPPETTWRSGASWIEEGLCDLAEYLFALETEHRYFTNYRNDHLHVAALAQFRHTNNFENEAEFGSRYPELMTTPTAASFIYFLLEHHGSMDDFMRVFDDVYLMKEVFGECMEEMIIKWRAYLDDFR